jgi:hypothetical protein
MKTPSNIVTRRRYKTASQIPPKGGGRFASERWPIWIRMVADLLQNAGRIGSEYAFIFIWNEKGQLHPYLLQPMVGDINWN